MSTPVKQEEMSPATLKTLREQLFEEDRITYAVLDGASIEGLLDVLAEHGPPHECLYRGELEPDLAECAPYLVQLKEQHPFTDYLLSGWGKHWGIFVTTDADITDLRRHFRRFLMVKDPDGKKLYFRYYDPRVISVFLPVGTPSQLKQMFGPIKRYFYETEAGKSLTVAEQKAGQPATRVVALKKVP